MSDITIERNYSGDYLISARLNNGDLFKRRYCFYTKREALQSFKQEFRHEQFITSTPYSDNSTGACYA